MNIPLYQVDAFTGRVFAGNPAAVCPLDEWPDDGLLQSIAAENNLSETAFFAPCEGGYRLRWFTPVAEVDLCGHATLATAFVLFRGAEASSGSISFTTRSGVLTAGRDGDLLVMDFPSRPTVHCDVPDALVRGLRATPLEFLVSEDYMAVFRSEADIRRLKPGMDELIRLDARGLIVTAPGDEVDFVSRFFAPKYGIDEDPVTGSAHCSLIPYWSERLKKKRLEARQVSSRGGELVCTDRGERVTIAGRAVLFMEGMIKV